jgi:transposase
MTTKSCGMELRERIVAARADGHSASEIARWYKVSKRSVERYWSQYLMKGTIHPKQRGGYRRSRLEGHEKTLKDWIEKEPDLTLEELQERCQDNLGVKIGTTALWERLDHLGLSFKKNAARRRARST